MIEQVARREIEKESENHIALGLLLRKDRPEEKKNAVQKVMSGDLSVPQKIEKIHDIDKMEEGEDVTRIVRQAAAQAVRRRISRIVQVIKAPQRPLPYFSFLFREHARMREFGRKNHVLEVGIWPPGVRVDPDMRNFFMGNLQSLSLALAPRLDYVAENGWLHLTPYQYNLVMLLRRLVERINAFAFADLDFRDRSVIEKLRRVENLFLMIHYRPDAVDVIVNAQRIVYEKQHAESAECDEVSGLILRILTEEGTLPSLYNCIVALNALKNRHLSTLQDLMHKGLGEMVSSRDFDCDPLVQKRIDEYVQASLDAIRRLHDQVYEARRLNRYITRDPDGNLDVARLRAFYNRQEGRETHDFAADQENLVVFTLRLLRKFDRTFSRLLNGQISVEGEQKAGVFSRSFYQTEFSRLRTVVEKLDKGPFSFNRFPLDHYRQIKVAQLGAVGNEMEARQLIDEGLASLVDLGKSLARVLSMKGPAPAAKGKVEPLELIILQGKPFSLPWEDRRISVKGILEGTTVADALAYAVSLCFTTGLFLQDQFLYLFLGREMKSQSELRSRIQLVENLLDPESFRELQSRYG